MNAIILFTFICFSVFLPINASVIEWDTQEGLKRTQSSEAKENFWRLSRFYESQINLTYCSIASSVIALNALGIEAPLAKNLGKYRLFTQEEFLSEHVRSIIDESSVKERGMTLEELSRVLSSFPLNVIAIKAIEHPHAEMREKIVAALNNPNQVVLALYHRKQLDQVGGGHWSPIAAYDANSDSFLVMDVARFKYPPVWVDATTFLNSMATTNIHGESRGFLILKKI